MSPVGVAVGWQVRWKRVEALPLPHFRPVHTWSGVWGKLTGDTGLTELAYGLRSSSLSYATFFSNLRMSFLRDLPSLDSWDSSSSSSDSSTYPSRRLLASLYSRLRRSWTDDESRERALSTDGPRVLWLPRRPYLRPRARRHLRPLLQTVARRDGLHRRLLVWAERFPPRLDPAPANLC